MITEGRAGFFLPSLAGGGAQRALVQIANEFACRDIATDLLVGDLTGPYIDEVSSSINLVDLGKSRVVACLPSLINYIWREKPSVLIATMMHANIIAIIAGLVSRSGTRVIVRESNVPEVWNGKPLAEGKSLLLRAASWLYPYADSVVCVSSGVRDSLSDALGLDESLTTVILNPVLSNEFFVKSTKKSTVPVEHLPGGDYIVAVGRLAAVKGFDVLIRAFFEFRKSSTLELLILGEGPERKSLVEMAESYGVAESVFMPGFVSNPFPLIKRASLFVMSSRREGLPNALIQAISLGCPVVVTEMPDGPLEILDGDRYGITVPLDDPISMSQAMLKALAKGDWPHPDQNWRARFSANSVFDAYLQLSGISLKKKLEI